MISFVTRDVIEDFRARLDAAFARPGRVYLVGETTLVYEGFRAWTEHLACAADVAPADRPRFERALQGVARAMDVEVDGESPADLIPMPRGYRDRARPLPEPPVAGGDGLTAPAAALRWYHFDPYGAAFRFIARGDEPDYRLVLAFLAHGWIDLDEMDALLDDLLPRFTCETIQQDPAEFRRKYKGLVQMWRAGRINV